LFFLISKSPSFLACKQFCGTLACAQKCQTHRAWAGIPFAKSGTGEQRIPSELLVGAAVLKIFY